MRLVVFSDIHGNIYALEKFISMISFINYDFLIFCGDIFGYYYAQKEILQRLSMLKDLIWLRGNHDEYFLNIYRGNLQADNYIKNYGHSYAQVLERFSKEDVYLIESHIAMYELYVDKCKIGIFHGTPDNCLEGRLYSNTPITKKEYYLQYDLVILGHTHCRMNRTIGHTTVINSGSLGQPRDGNGFGFAIIDTKKRTVDFRNVVFDKQRLYEQIDFYDKGLAKLKEVLERRSDCETHISNSY